MSIRFENIDATGTINGVGKDYLSVTGEVLSIGQGFDDESISSASQDVIIDQNAYKTYFNNEGNPIGQTLLIGNVPARIVGVLSEKHRPLPAPVTRPPSICLTLPSCIACLAPATLTVLLYS
ncbi:hypothetical protein B0182_05950 [Moraxella bovis]|uniref:Macrolide export ATP-binding/permease protein MacB n=1 Tax=Moraxella bovis TaxID=476 RepID=A0A1T0A3X8_MORBO|nr:hypothetical protein B0182_05950 [Moraxella bovis]STY91405.1 Macrolide export ATP-binding/permease protein MacB [Moraxella bovis]